ncbi:MAG: hypothetical protein LBM77_01250 [Spirochaetaceae bacterium]|jgi:hypothetical protein|nr:hypothetical protein [Spirochaetaceae bacterium]
MSREMTEEEAEYWDKYYTENTPQTDPTRPGVFARRKAARMVELDNLSADYLLTKFQATNKLPTEIIHDMVCHEMAAA